MHVDTSASSVMLLMGLAVGVDYCLFYLRREREERAAVIMVAVFAVFGTLSLQQFKQLSVGLAVAVLLDATVVRGVLLPSAMALLGDHNWYLPRWLHWLPPTPPPETPGPAGPGTRPAAPEPAPAGRA